MAVKRRTVWLDDEDWRRLALLGRTRSQAIHQWVAPEGVQPIPWFGPSPMPDALDLDIARRTFHPLKHEFDADPKFDQFHPVPKPGKK